MALEERMASWTQGVGVGKSKSSKERGGSDNLAFTSWLKGAFDLFVCSTNTSSACMQCDKRLLTLFPCSTLNNL